MIRQMINFTRYSPFRRPDWRFERVLQMLNRIDAAPGRSVKRDDIYVRGMRQFLLRLRNTDDDRTHVSLVEANPGMYWAYQIYETKERESKHITAMMEARILAGQDDEEIATDIATIPEVVEWYEALFFNVRDRLSAHDWILDKVLMPSVDRASASAAVIAADIKNNKALPSTKIAAPFFDVTLRFFAYFGGRVILDHVMSGFRRGQFVYSREETNQWFDDHTKSSIRRRAAAAASTFEVNSDNVMALLGLHARIMEIEKSTDSIANKQDTLHRLVGDMMQEMPWAIGDSGAKSVADTPIAAYDQLGAELRDDELLLTASGATVDGADELMGLTMPQPRAKENGPADEVKL